jgi:hypothetical protein
LLLPAGVRLSQAEDLLTRRESDLSGAVADYIRRSREADTSRRSRLEWERLEAEASKLRAIVEDHHARALRNDLLAEQVRGQRSRPDRDEYLATLNRNAAKFRSRAADLWRQASTLEDELKIHPGAPSQAEKRALLRPTVFALEIVDVGQGECLLVHYGPPDAPRRVLVDGGPDRAFARHLRPRLCELQSRLSPGLPLPIELLLVSHADNDRVKGITDLLVDNSKALERGEAPLVEIRRLWYNHFLPIRTTDASRAASRKAILPELARQLQIPLNVPFDYYVMPADTGPARLTLPGGLEVTVLGPPASRIRDWAAEWKRIQQRSAGPPRSLGDELGMLSDGFSSPEITLVRSSPGMPSIAQPAELPSRRYGSFADKSVTNLSSIVALFEIQGRRMLFTGDARGDEILRALEMAGYVGASGRIHLDILKLPHFGSTRTLTSDFFAMIAADHYVITGFVRHGLPQPDVLRMIAASREGEEFQVHVSIGEDTIGLQHDLEVAFCNEKIRGCRGVLHFRPEGAASHRIDLADPTEW